MLEKNKDYVEMRVSSTDCASAQNEGARVRVEGYVYTTYMNIPDPGELYIFISKEKFERLQANFDFNAELAKQWEINYNLLLKKTGFDTVEELVNYIYDDGPNSQGDWKNLKEILDDAEVDYISERYKAEALEKENEELKKKFQVPDPFAEYKEMLKKLNSAEDAENLEWVLNHTCGGQASVNGWMVTAKLWRQNYETLSKLVGFSSVEEIQDYLTNEAEADTLHEAISKLKDQVKYTCDKWYSANSSNNSWKAAAECNTPKELIEKREALEKEIEVYSRALKDWKEGTGCPSPSAVKTALESGASWMTAYRSSCEVIKTWKKLTGCPTPIVAKTLIESGMSYEHGYHEVQEENRKLTDDINSWENVTGHSTPEDYLHARIHCATPFDYTAAWQKATGCNTPEEAKNWINQLDETAGSLNKELLSWYKATGCGSPEAAEAKIKHYKSRLGNAIQAASCASKHLDNITF